MMTKLVMQKLIFQLKLVKNQILSRGFAINESNGWITLLTISQI